MSAVAGGGSGPLLVQVSLCFRPIGGGQEVYISNLARVLADAGWQTRVVQPYRGVLAPDIAVVPRIPGVARFLSYADELQFAVFAALFRSRLLSRSDVILCHYASTAAFIGRVAPWRRKLIVLSHGVEWNVDRMNRHDRVREHNAQKLFGSVATVANDTDYLRRVGLGVMPAQDWFSEVATDTWFIPNCVDTCRFVSGLADDSRRPRQKRILVPRQICEDRGIHLAIEAMARLRVIDPGVRMKVVGPVRDQRYYRQCLKRVIELGLGEYIEFVPPAPNEAMVEFYQAADVTLIPTIRREGTSLSALESMACGVPVVATEVAGLRDLPAHLCKPEPEAVARSLQKVLANLAEEAERQGTIVREVFNLKNWSKAWIKAIEKVRSRRCI